MLFVNCTVKGNSPIETFINLGTNINIVKKNYIDETGLIFYENNIGSKIEGFNRSINALGKIDLQTSFTVDVNIIGASEEVKFRDYVSCEWSNLNKGFNRSINALGKIDLQTSFTVDVLLEGSQRAVKLKVDLSDAKDLDDFVLILKRVFEELENVRPQNIVFLDSNNTPILPDTCLQSLVNDTAAKNPFIIRYLLSKKNVVVNYTYRHKQGKCKIQHTTGSLSSLREAVVERFTELQAEKFYFFNDGEGDIWNEYYFNDLVLKTELVCNDYNLKLKIKVKDKKPYGDWDLKEVFTQILGQESYVTIDDIPRFYFDDLPPLINSFSEDELNTFIKSLNRTYKAYQKEIHANEATPHAYINSFMETAVCFTQEHINDSTKLRVEIPLNGSRGYGPIDYVVEIITILVLMCEAKSENMNKETAQVLVQMKSAMEAIEHKSFKCKLDHQEAVMFEIVTTGKLWQFIRWTELSETSTVHTTEEFTRSFSDEMEIEKKMLNYIAQLLQFQANIGFKNDNNDSDCPPKRQYMKVDVVTGVFSYFPLMVLLRSL
ncbi:hypothetical protein Glove_181g12 [Diversispora epigaea]|uniref:Uncharacterized protein n=1 Tax=Diversispora epigaea TaxID=1348612 RepID=A0A397IN58_9GLOM|nr:hypothetical protein Glove_181g12 [Diversispora epigaea]